MLLGRGLGPTWGQPGVGLGSILVNFGLGSFWVSMESTWGEFGVSLGSILSIIS